MYPSWILFWLTLSVAVHPVLLLISLAVGFSRVCAFNLDYSAKKTPISDTSSCTTCQVHLFGITLLFDEKDAQEPVLKLIIHVEALSK